MAISVITLQELYEGQSTRDQIKENYMLSILTPLKILPYTEEVAKKAGTLARDNQTLADLADLAIAATAIVYKTPLATLNAKHFSSLKGLDLI